MSQHISVFQDEGIFYFSRLIVEVLIRAQNACCSRHQCLESDVSRRQILTTKVYPRTGRVKIFLMVVDPYHMYSNETERAN